MYEHGETTRRNGRADGRRVAVVRTAGAASNRGRGGGRGGAPRRRADPLRRPERRYGDAGGDGANALVLTDDGGYAVAGASDPDALVADLDR